MRKLTASLLIAELTLGLLTSPSRAGDRVEVPIQQTILSDGTPRYSVAVSIGSGPQVEAMLDTGSTGLRVLAFALADTAYRPTPLQNDYGYTSGVRFRGSIAYAIVGIGGAETKTPIRIQVIQSVSCGERQPNCPVERIGPDSYLIGGKGIPNEGFQAIIGVAMHPFGSIPLPTHIVNPLAHVGDAWIVDLPRPGQTGPGTLIINPNPSDLFGFKMFPIAFQDLPPDERDGGLLDAPFGCILNRDTSRPFCGRIGLDSGAPDVRIHLTGAGQPRSWPNDTRGTLSFGVPGTEGVSYDFISSRNLPGSHVNIEVPFGPQPQGIYAGVLPYFGFSVLYDYAHGVVGLKPRP